MTDLTRIFIAGPSDEANALLFAQALAEGSDAAIRAAREDASHLASMMDRFTEIAPRLWAAMQGDMRRVIDKARGQRGYADMADVTRAGYCTVAIEMYLAALKPATGTTDKAVVEGAAA
ncbi:hypothetical protein [Hoeflea sp.]|uniref:hypothetical protein n=1 Tax=Hoeflea sp. TaxID=1940281 RepID=UPI0019A3B031|nr:hypothetical protein [Hoeflea sp.]MBC7280007.1 hypothetical protein [Hoeflea sp.]